MDQRQKLFRFVPCPESSSALCGKIAASTSSDRDITLLWITSITEQQRSSCRHISSRSLSGTSCYDLPELPALSVDRHIFDQLRSLGGEVRQQLRPLAHFGRKRFCVFKTDAGVPGRVICGFPDRRANFFAIWRAGRCRGRVSGRAGQKQVACRLRFTSREPSRPGCDTTRR